MASAAVEKTEEELRKEIEELHRQQWEITQRLRDPRGLRRGAAIASNGSTTALPRQRGFVRPADRVDSEDQPAPKRRLSSAVVKVEDGELVEDANGAKDVKEQDLTVDVETIASDENDNKLLSLQQRGGFRTDAKQRASRTMDDETQATVHVPRVLPKNEDPSLVDRNKRMLGRMLGTLASTEHPFSPKGKRKPFFPLFHRSSYLHWSMSGTLQCEDQGSMSGWVCESETKLVYE